MLAATPLPHGSASCCLPAIVRRVPAMGGGIRFERELLSMNNHFNSFQFAAVLSSLGPLHFMLADASSPRNHQMQHLFDFYCLHNSRMVEILNALSCVAYRETQPIFGPSVGLLNGFQLEQRQSRSRVQIPALGSAVCWSSTWSMGGSIRIGMAFRSVAAAESCKLRLPNSGFSNPFVRS